MLANFFIQNLLREEDRFFYVVVVATVMVSIIVHELAHGLAALWQGDDTPRVSGHLTLNPVVHMGWYSITFLFLVGIAWGQMPVNPARFRSRRGEIWVALAGPASNLGLAWLALTGLGVMELLLWGWDNSVMRDNLRNMLLIFGSTNLVLCVFNLIPVPPMDGSVILARLDRRYADLVADPSRQGVFFLAFALVFMFSGKLYVWANVAAVKYLLWLMHWWHRL